MHPLAKDCSLGSASLAKSLRPNLYMGIIKVWTKRFSAGPLSHREFFSKHLKTWPSNAATTTMVLPLTTSRPIEPYNPPIKRRRRIIWWHWPLGWQCWLAAGSRGRQHHLRRLHVLRRWWRQWVDSHPFLHCWSNEIHPSPPSVCTPTGYDYPRRVMPLLQQLGGDRWPNCHFSWAIVVTIVPASEALDGPSSSKGTHQPINSITQQSNASKERVDPVEDGQG